MKAARGEWLAFVDADDYLIDGGLAYVVEHFCRQGNDVVGYKMVTLNPYQLKNWVYSDMPEGKVLWEGGGVEAYNRYRYEWVIDKVFRRSFLEAHGLVFDPLYVSEDAMFNFRVFQCNPHVVMTDSNIYRYEQANEQSLMHRKGLDKMRREMEAQLTIITEWNAYLSQKDAPMQYGVKKSLEAHVRSFYTRSFRANLSKKEWNQYMQRLKKQPYHRAGMEGRWVIVGFLLNLVSHSFRMYRIFRFFYNSVFEKHVRQHLP
jgi:cellulose synthase/poly-beta-1,6-N-acetylglucosamine synthase-like glycosyltransferase